MYRYIKSGKNRLIYLCEGGAIMYWIGLGLFVTGFGVFLANNLL